MADIVVTIPKGYFDEPGFYTKDTFRIGRRPKRLEEGDTIFLVYQGEVLYRAYFDGFIDDVDCGATENYWDGINLEFSDFKELEKPVPLKGFRGFRYVDRLPAKVRKALEAA